MARRRVIYVLALLIQRPVVRRTHLHFLQDSSKLHVDKLSVFVSVRLVGWIMAYSLQDA